ncbi:unnamed protein product [Rhizopus stolonifer]
MGQQASKEPLGYIYQIEESVEHITTEQTICEQCNSRDCSACYLEKDLAYVDQTYYPELIPAITENKSMCPITTKKKHRRLLRGVLSIDLSHRTLVELSPSVESYKHLTNLVLSNNQLTVLPNQVGYLKSLCVLNVSENQLSKLPETLGLLSKLKILDASRNRLETLPPSIGRLSELSRLVVSENQLKTLPKELSGLNQLVCLVVSSNPLRALPAEIATLGKLTKLLVDGCDFQGEYVNDLQHNPVSLMETCARTLVRHDLDIPPHLKAYFLQVHRCSYCHGPYFERYVIRYRRTQNLVLQHTLCSAHWSDEEDRILTLFSDRPQEPSTQFFLKQQESEWTDYSESKCNTNNSINTFSK